MGLFDWMRTNIFGGSPRSAAEQAEEQRIISEMQQIQGKDAEVGGLNFQTAIEAHMKWRERLEAVINGTSTEKIDPETIFKDDQCVLGKWIIGDGKVYEQLPQFHELRATHTHFHHVAARILRDALGGHREEAKAQIAGEYRKTSIKIGGLLSRMHTEAKKLAK
ncbi:MAG: CZB domain-containing protein [Kofleriaceae bacterium]